MLLSISTIHAQINNSKTVTAKVNGNCGMCKSTIEKVGNIKLESKVVWNPDTKEAKITFDAKKTDLNKILKRIAQAGYDNQLYQAPNDVYENLHGCCQYDREVPELAVKEIEKDLAVEGSAFQAIKIGDELPAITLKSNKETNINLSDFKNKYVLIDFWASWCKPCREANKSLVTLYKETDRKNFEIVAISIDTEKVKWIKAIAMDQLKYTQLIDDNGFDSKTAILFGIEAIPSSFLFNSKGILIAKNPSEEEILNLINKK